MKFITFYLVYLRIFLSKNFTRNGVQSIFQMNWIPNPDFFKAKTVTRPKRSKQKFSRINPDVSEEMGKVTNTHKYRVALAYRFQEDVLHNQKPQRLALASKSYDGRY